jgi:dsDNA-binding SOS-regulon protein
MPVRVTVELPEELAERARAAAARTSRPFEEMLVEWIDRAAADNALDAMPDAEVLSLCDSRLNDEQQEELSSLLVHNREGLLQPQDRRRLDELMQIYRRGLVRKAQALNVAVSRGLRPSLQ